MNAPSESEPETNEASAPTDLRSGVQRGEILLAFGAILFVLTMALTHFVMGIFLAVIPGALALAFLAAGATRARNPAGKIDQCAIGFLLLFAGFCVLAVVGFQACDLSYREAFHHLRPSSPPPALSQWAKAGITWLLPVAFILPGLRYWTNWSPRRRLVWSIFTFTIPVAIIIAHQILTQLGFPLTA